MSIVGPRNFDIAWQINAPKSGDDFHKYRVRDKEKKKKKIKISIKTAHSTNGNTSTCLSVYTTYANRSDPI